MENKETKLKLTKEEREALKKERAELKKQQILEGTKSIMVNTFDGKVSLFSLINDVGVKNKVEYYNIVEQVAPKEIRKEKYFISDEVVHDYGFIFNNGFEIRHSSKELSKLIDSEVIKKRERNPNL